MAKSATLSAFFAPRPAKKKEEAPAPKRHSEESTSSTEAKELPAAKKSKAAEASGGRLRKNADASEASDDDADVLMSEAPAAPEAAAEAAAAEEPKEEEPKEEEPKEEEKKKAPVFASQATKTKPAEPAWASTGSVPYSAIASVFEAIEATTKRLEIQGLVRDLLGSVIAFAPGDLEAVLFLLCNKVAPAFENLEMGIGDSLLQKAVANSFGKSAKVVKAEYEKLGDLGIVAEEARKGQRFMNFGAKPKALNAAKVLAAYREICAISGSKSQDAKVGKMQKLMIAASPLEARYVTRGLQGKLRIGLAESTVLVGLAHAAARWPSPAAAADEEKRLAEEDEDPLEEHPTLDLGRETTGAQGAVALRRDARLRRAKAKRVLSTETVLVGAAQGCDGGQLQRLIPRSMSTHFG